MTHQSLTEKQRPVYEFIKAYMREHGCSPYIHEVQAACQIRSYKSALDRLVALERKGLIRRLPNKHRGIELVEPAPLITQPAAPLAPESGDVQVTA